MIFWDSSAIVPLLVAESESAAVHDVAIADSTLVVWWGSIVECWSALARRERDGHLPTEAVDEARDLLRELGEAWIEIAASRQVRDHAERLLLRHPIRAADALQLGAALTWAGGQPERHPLCTFDARLAAAARGEGFRLVLR